MKRLTRRFPATTFLATGQTDLVVSAHGQWRLENGVLQLDRFTGTGDIVGALIAALLGVGSQTMQLWSLPLAILIVAVKWLRPKTPAASRHLERGRSINYPCWRRIRLDSKGERTGTMNAEALQLYLVTNRYADSPEVFLAKIAAACENGVTMVQYGKNP